MRRPEKIAFETLCSFNVEMIWFCVSHKEGCKPPLPCEQCFYAAIVLVPRLAVVAFNNGFHAGERFLKFDDFVEFQVGVLEHLINDAGPCSLLL